MQGMIFAAGLGTRLLPITENKPKALVKVGEKTLLEIVINKMVDYGIKRIVVNVHHFAQDIISFLNSKSFGCEILVSDEREELLDTGGGVKKAWQRGLFDKNEDILIHNVDILSAIDFNALYDCHFAKQHLVTLCVQKRETQRYLLFNENNVLCGREAVNKKIFTRKYTKLYKYAFSGIQIISPEILDKIRLEGKISIIDAYMELSKEYDINCFLDNGSIWMDVGKPDSLALANTTLKFI